MNLLLLSIFSLVLFLQGQVSADITCYECVFIQGDSTTSQSCEKTPTDLEKATLPSNPPPKGSTYESTPGFSNNTDRFQITKDGTYDDNFKYGYCATLKGTLSGKKYIQRGILGSNMNYKDRNCLSGYKPPSTPLPVENPILCTCNENLCNVGDWDEGDKEDPTTTTDAGVDSIRLSLSLLLIPVFALAGSFIM